MRVHVGSDGDALLPNAHSWQWIGTTGDRLAVDAALHGVWTRHRPDGSSTVIDTEVSLTTYTIDDDGGHAVGTTALESAAPLYEIDVEDGSARVVRPAGEGVIRNVVTTAGGDVLFSEEIGERVTLYRLNRHTGVATVVATGDSFSGVSAVPSPYDDTAVAWFTAGGCGGPPHAEATVDGRRLPLAGTPVAEMPPEAWMSDGTLVFVDRGESCDYSPGSLWTFKNRKAIKIADGIVDAAIRPVANRRSADGAGTVAPMRSRSVHLGRTEVRRRVSAERRGGGDDGTSCLLAVPLLLGQL